MRHSKKLRDTRIWEIYSQKVLDEDQGYSRLGWVEEVFEVSTNYLSLVRDTFPNYTLHNERHVLNVIDIMGGLLGDQISNLTCAEAECPSGERRAGRTETADQGDAGVSGTAVHKGYG
ncbi:MAG TPA: hypothetical protein IAD31_06785, partial [Candidatus Enterenecus faecium]|nr:hypothetical protein [Candidatus Enterenecus faecium]